VTIGEYLQEKAGRTIDERMARVAQAAGVFPYLRQTARKSFFEGIFNQMKKVGSNWSAYEQHGELLRSFKDYGGLASCPEEVRTKITKWMVLTYVGTPGGQTRFGNIRHVYYSNTAAPIIEELFKESMHLVADEIENLARDKDIKRALSTEHIVRRFDRIRDLVISD